MSELSKQLGERIRMFRLNRGLSQEKLGEKSDLNTSFIGQIERGGKKPTIESLEKIVKALDITFKELFAFEQEISKSQDTSFAEKIAFELNGRPQDEQEAIYRLVKQILQLKDKK